MQIINFSGGTEEVPDHPSAPTPAPPNAHGLHFTCSTCDAKLSTAFTKMLFRSMEFECADCGTHFRITNPAYAARPVTRTKT